MRLLSQRIDSSVRINGQMLGSSLCAMGAWAIWPQTAAWWAMSILSILLGMTALGALINGLKLMLGVYEHDCALAEFEAIGPEPRSATLASADALEQAGMI